MSRAGEQPAEGNSTATTMDDLNLVLGHKISRSLADSESLASANRSSSMGCRVCRARKVSAVFFSFIFSVCLIRDSFNSHAINLRSNATVGPTAVAIVNVSNSSVLTMTVQSLAAGVDQFLCPSGRSGLIDHVPVVAYQRLNATATARDVHDVAPAISSANMTEARLLAGHATSARHQLQARLKKILSLLWMLPQLLGRV